MQFHPSDGNLKRNITTLALKSYDINQNFSPDAGLTFTHATGIYLLLVDAGTNPDTAIITTPPASGYSNVCGNANSENTQVNFNINWRTVLGRQNLLFNTFAIRLKALAFYPTVSMSPPDYNPIYSTISCIVTFRGQSIASRLVQTYAQNATNQAAVPVEINSGIMSRLIPITWTGPDWSGAITNKTFFPINQPITFLMDDEGEEHVFYNNDPGTSTIEVAFVDSMTGQYLTWNSQNQQAVSNNYHVTQTNADGTQIIFPIRLLGMPNFTIEFAIRPVK